MSRCAKRRTLNPQSSLCHASRSISHLAQGVKKVNLKQRLKQEAASEKVTKTGRTSPSILDLLTRSQLREEPPTPAEASAGRLRAPKIPIGCIEQCITELKQKITLGHDLRGEPWVHPQNPFRAARDTVNDHSAYVVTRHVCTNCSSTSRARGARARNRQRKEIAADAREVRQSLPEYIGSMWCFIDTGRTMRDASVMDFVRAMATKASWAAIADAINESKLTRWARDVTLRYLQLCDMLNISSRLRVYG